MDLRMPDLNLILLAGNLTNDLKYSETKNGTPVVNFYMASNKRFKDRNGIVKEDSRRARKIKAWSLWIQSYGHP